MGILDAIQNGPVVEAAPLRAARAQAPSGFEPGVRFDPVSGVTTVTTGQVPSNVQGDPDAWAALIADLGATIPEGFKAVMVEARYDPVAWTRDTEYVGGDDPKNQIRKKPATTKPAWRYRFRIEPITGAETPVDFASLLGIAARNITTPPRVSARSVAATRTRLVAVSDEQIGKVDKNGGLEAFAARMVRLKAQLVEIFKVQPCADAVLLFGGDLIEGFENHAGQLHTNQISHPKQLQVAREYVTDIVTTVAAHHKTVRVLAVPSNHGSWRAGKGYLGRPGDDYGLDAIRAVAEALSRDPKLAKRISFIFPPEWEVSVAVQVRGDVVALTHGHFTQGPKTFQSWFDGQLRGDSPISAATLVFSGHFHHLIDEPLGNIGTKERRHIQLRALDAGSAHHTNAKGDHTKAGVYTCVITDSHGRDHIRDLIDNQ